MSDLMKKVFNDKRYQFGYNDAMDVAFNNERELKAKIRELKTKIKELTAAKYDDLMNDAYSRGWVDALAEAHEWSNPTAALEDE